MTTELSVLLADDEPLARHLLREFLRAHTDLTLLGECEDGLQAAREIVRLAPDLILLDINMPQLSGLEVLELTGRRHGVIFTTAYDEHALRAFDLHAVDYLLKPFSQQRFDLAIHRARALANKPEPALNALLQAHATPLERVLIRDREQVIVVEVATIEFIEAQDDYIALHTGSRCHLKSERLRDIETRLNPRDFVRVHRSYLINLHHLRALEKHGRDGHVALLTSGTRVPVSRSGYERLTQVV
jgi:two-component system LytT family response regulator